MVSADADNSLINIPKKINNAIDNFKDRKLKKTVIVNGNAETQIIETPDWKQELSLFLSADINKPAWLDKYKEYVQNEKQIIEATDDKLIIKKVIIDKKNIEIFKEKSNLLYSSKEQLKWNESEKSYSIITDRKVIFGEWNHIEIKGNIQ